MMATPRTITHERIITEVGRERYLDLYGPRIRDAVADIRLTETDPRDFSIVLGAFTEELVRRAPEPWQVDVRQLVEAAVAQLRN